MRNWSRVFAFGITSLIAVFILGSAVLANELAVGTAAKSKEVFSIPPVPVRQLNFLKRSEILGMRANQIQGNPLLLLDDYEPKDKVFALVEDGKPWWGLWGANVFPSVPKSILGPARQSMYVLNPLRLVCVEPAVSGIWNTHAVTDADFKDVNFPWDWKCGPVRFDPNKSSAEVTYYVSEYHRRLSEVKDKLVVPPKIDRFSLIAYNARDFGYNFVYLDPQRSANMKSWLGSEPVQITQMLHCGGSCGYPGGCNNMSPTIKNLDNNFYTALPARLYLKLWKMEPDKVTEEPDLVFVINLE